jgi:hypothetical protein
MANGFKQWFGDIRQRELIPDTLFAVDGDEINSPLRVNPRRNLVWQIFASRDFHGGIIGTDTNHGKALVGTSRCNVPARATAGGMNHVPRTNSNTLPLAPLNAARTPQRGVPT